MSGWKVPYIDLAAHYQALKGPLDEAISRVMASGKYTSGPETERFEESMARYLGVKHVIGVGNGYDALFLSLKAMNAFGRVLAPSYTHISTHAAIEHSGCELVLDEGRDIRIVIPVHMNGRYNGFHSIHLPHPEIEDACQAIGTAYKGKKVGTFGLMGCFSLHPFKVLSCAGDGGFISTNDDAYAERLKWLRTHKGDPYGYNSRLDNIQAAILNVKLPYLESFIHRRREIASTYEEELPEWVQKPPAPSTGDYFDTYSSYVIGGSPELLAHMRGKGIECHSHIRTDVVSLPIYPEMKEGHIAMVVAAVKAFRG